MNKYAKFVWDLLLERGPVDSIERDGEIKYPSASIKNYKDVNFVKFDEPAYITVYKKSIFYSDCDDAIPYIQGIAETDDGYIYRILVDPELVFNESLKHFS